MIFDIKHVRTFILCVLCIEGFCYCHHTIKYDAHEALAQLGYDPDVRVLFDQSRSDSDKQLLHPTLYINGWGTDREWSERWLKKSNLFVMPAITYKLPDDDQTNIYGLCKTSFGQWSDIAPTLYILKKCYDAGCTGIDLFGFSRGGATILNTLEVLHTYSYPQSLEKLGIDKKTCKGILSMIQKGCITLDAPLKHVYPVVKAQVRKKRIHLLNGIQHKLVMSLCAGICNTDSFLGDCIDTMGAICLNYLIFPILMSYKPWRHQAITSAKKLKDLNLTFLINYEKSDMQVTDYGNKELYEILAHDHIVYCVVSNDAGHAATRKTLGNVFHAFKHVHGHVSETKNSKEQSISLLNEFNKYALQA